MDQRRLPRAVGADERMALAVPKLEIDAVGHDQRAEGFPKAGEFENRRHGVPRTRSSRPTRPPRAWSAIRTRSGPKISRQSWVIDESTSSSRMKKSAPMSAPFRVAMPPRTTMTMRSPERCQAAQGRADEGRVGRPEDARDGGDHARDDVGGQAVAEDGVAHGGHAGRVLTRGAEHPAKAGADDAVGQRPGGDKRPREPPSRSPPWR